MHYLNAETPRHFRRHLLSEDSSILPGFDYKIQHVFSLSYPIFGSFNSQSILFPRLAKNPHFLQYNKHTIA